MAFYLGDVAATVPAIEECLALARAEGATQETARALSMMGELASLQDADAAHRLLERERGPGPGGGRLLVPVVLAGQPGLDRVLQGPVAGRPPVHRGGDGGRPPGQRHPQPAPGLGVHGLGRPARGRLLRPAATPSGRSSWASPWPGSWATSAGPACMLNGQGELAWRRGDYDAAGRLLDESAEIGRRLGSPYALAPPYGLLGRRAKAMGNLEEAAAWFEAALDISRQAGMHLFVPWWVWGRADVYRLAGDHPSALTWLAEARSVAEAVGNEPVVAFTIWARGAIARARGTAGRGRRPPPRGAPPPPVDRRRGRHPRLAGGAGRAGRGPGPGRPAPPGCWPRPAPTGRSTAVPGPSPSRRTTTPTWPWPGPGCPTAPSSGPGRRDSPVPRRGGGPGPGRDGALTDG